MTLKKTNHDLILLILLVLRIELDSNTIQYRSWNREPESRSVHLGSTSAYTQISIPLNYPHPKSLDPNELDSTLFSRLNYFHSVRRDSFITCIVNHPDNQAANAPEDTTSPQGNLPNVPDINGGAINELSNSNETLDLTREDMDLIEILWKQDIDLGVSRDAYDSRQTVEVEKLKDIEFAQDKDLFVQKDVKPSEEPILVPDPFHELNYTIDSETGEYILDEFSRSLDLNTSFDPFCEDEALLPDKNKHFENELLKETESLGSLLNLDTFLPFDDNNTFCDVSELFTPSEISQMIPDDLTSNPNYFFPQIEDVEKEFEQFGLLNETNEINSTRGEMYPNMEDCWPDATTMMPLLALSGSYQGSLTPVQTSPNINPSARLSNEGYVLETSVPTTDSDFQPISSSIGTSSIGFAVAESIATLTNDSDPVPTGSVTNNVYGADLPELLYANHTVAVSHNELIPDLFLDEELQLMTLPNGNEEKQREDQMDTSSDSVSSGHLPPTSDYENGSFSDTAFQQRNCNDQQYFTLKTYYSDPSENSACAVSCGVMNFNKKFDYSLPKATGFNCSNFLQHNHTYHMPFNTSDDSCHKPVVRDKQRSSSDDDICNKDEKRAKELKLPISIADIINLAIDEYNERLSKYELTEAQITLIRDIRRRGKNKVAAQNCRKRKMDQINNLQQDLDFLQNEKLKLKSKQNNLLQQKHLVKEKYIQLYELILRNTNSRPPNVPSHLSISNSSRTSSDTLVGNADTNVNGGVRTKRKFKK